MYEREYEDVWVEENVRKNRYDGCIWWERMGRCLSSEKNDPSDNAKNRLFSFFNLFYLKLQIITKRWNNRECGGHDITCESNRRVVLIFLIRKFQPCWYRVWIRIFSDWPISLRQRLLFKGMWSFWHLEKDSASFTEMSPIITGPPQLVQIGFLIASFIDMFLA